MYERIQRVCLASEIFISAAGDVHWLGKQQCDRLRKAFSGARRYVYGCVVLYNSAGMTQADIEKDAFTGQYGCAITAGFGIIFGEEHVPLLPG